MNELTFTEGHSLDVPGSSSLALHGDPLKGLKGVHDVQVLELHGREGVAPGTAHSQRGTQRELHCARRPYCIGVERRVGTRWKERESSFFNDPKKN